MGKRTDETASRSRRPRVKQNVVAHLAKRILSGEFPADTLLPREDELCVEYQVSRTVIREATKLLESKGLLKIRPRAGTRVLNSTEWNMLDADLLLWTGKTAQDPGFLSSLIEARRVIEPAAAEFAALRATALDLHKMEDAYNRMRASMPDNPEAWAVADVDFHAALLRASHNHVLARMVTVTSTLMNAMFTTMTRVGSSHEDALILHGKVLEAVRLRQPEVARQAILAIISQSAVDLERGHYLDANVDDVAGRESSPVAAREQDGT